MYIRHPDSKETPLQELTVWEPPYNRKQNIGYVWNYFNNKWEPRPIFSRSNSKKEKYWERPEPDFDYKKERRKEISKQAANPEYVDPKLEEYREQEWDRRINGFWFMNYNSFTDQVDPTFITGQHYFYLTHWQIDNGFPDYRRVDRDYFMYCRYAQDDPKCFGVIEMTKRRAGKSYRAACMGYEIVSRGFNKHTGIQSKSGDDAKRFFTKLVQSFKKLPDFFVPEYDTDGIKSSLYLRKTYKKGQKVTSEDDELEGSITFGSGDNLFYDGSKLHVYIKDEAGKIDTPDPKHQIYEGWRIIKPAMTEDEDIIGFALYTSTIEEQGSEAFEKMWKESNPQDRLKAEDGMTTSGLYRFFVPAHHNHFREKDPLKKYGQCDEDYAKHYHEVKRAKEKKEGSRAYASYVRKFPFIPSEAFWRDADKSPFPVDLLNEQLDVLKGQEQGLFEGKEDKDIIGGNFVWEDNIEDGKAIFVPNPRGRFRILRKLTLDEKGEYDPNWQDKWNRVSTGNIKNPQSTTSIIAGADTYDHKVIDLVDSHRKSMGSMHVFHKFDALNSDLSETFLCEYLSRPPDPDDFFEDAIKMCHFFGCKILVERAKVGINNYFDRRGYGSWLAKERGKPQRGIAAGPESKQQMAEVVESYITNNIDKVLFERLIIDWLAFDLEDSTKNDLTMSSGWTLVGAYRIDRNLAPKKNRFKYQKTSKHKYNAMQALANF